MDRRAFTEPQSRPAFVKLGWIPDDSDVTQGPQDPTSSLPTVAESLVCPACRYDLRTIASDRCPECGLPIDRDLMSVSRIPWQHRRQIGHFGSFWRTVRLVLFSPGKFAGEVNRPVDYRSAVRFQLVAVTLGSLAQSAWTAGPLLYDVPHLRGGSSTDWVMFVTVCLAVWVYNYLASTVPSYWFRPEGWSREKQDRAAALSYYASAALTVLLVPGLMFSAYAVLDAMQAIPDPLQPLIPLTAVILIAATFVYGYFLSLKLMRLTTGCDPGRTLTMAILLPTQWFLCGVLTFLLPLAVYYLWLAIIGSY